MLGRETYTQGQKIMDALQLRIQMHTMHNKTKGRQD